MRLAYSPRPASEIEVRTILLGIDVGVAELLLAGHLRRKGVPVDAVVAHHTPNAGVAFNLAQDIMGLNVEMVVAQGVPLEDARRVIDPYVHERWLGNEDFHRQGPTTARELGLPFGCIHTPADYAFEAGIREVLQRERPATSGDVLRALLTIPEVQSAAHLGAFPRVMSGDPRQPLGRYMVKGGGGRIFPPGAYPCWAGRAQHRDPDRLRAGARQGGGGGRGVHRARAPRGVRQLRDHLWLDSAIREHGPLEVIGCAAFERIERIERGQGA